MIEHHDPMCEDPSTCLCLVERDPWKLLAKAREVVKLANELVEGRYVGCDCPAIGVTEVIDDHYFFAGMKVVPETAGTCVGCRLRAALKEAK